MSSNISFSKTFEKLDYFTYPKNTLFFKTCGRLTSGHLKHHILKQRIHNIYHTFIYIYIYLYLIYTICLYLEITILLMWAYFLFIRMGYGCHQIQRELARNK